MPRPLDQQLRMTYFSLRFGVAVIGIAFPFLLWFGGKLFYGLKLRPSMSAYYWATPEKPDLNCHALAAEIDTRPTGSMRNWFVGVLFAVGAMLYVNKGSSSKESYALTLAGIFATSIAIVPMRWDCKDHGRFNPHYILALAFFASIAYVCVFCSEETLKLISDTKKRAAYRRWYHLLAVCMLVSPIVSWVLTAKQHFAFLPEAAGILCFGSYWLIKSHEIAFIVEEKKRLGVRTENMNLPV